MNIASLRLVVITDRHVVRHDFLASLSEALEGGATAILLREKDLDSRDLYPLAVQVRQLTLERQAALIISDRADLALAVGADAVHLGWRSLPIEAVRKAVGDRCQVGFSAHNPLEAEGAIAAGAHYLTYSPIFQTPSKAGVVPTVGLDGLESAARQFSIPLVALGGITPETAGLCLSAGAVGVAAIRSVLAAPNVREAAAAFRASPPPPEAPATD